MSADTMTIGDDQENYSSYTSVVLNVAMVLVISLVLSLVTVVLTDTITQIAMIMAGALIIGVFAFRLSHSLFLAVAIALVVAKPTMMTAILPQNPETVAIYSLVTAGVVIPEILRISASVIRTRAMAIDVLSIAITLLWLVFSSLVTPLVSRGIIPGISWVIGVVDAAFLLQAMAVVAYRPRGGLWRSLWAGAMVSSVLIDIATAHVFDTNDALLPVLSLTSVTVAALAYLAVYWYRFEPQTPALDEGTVVWRQWFITLTCISMIVVSHVISRQGATSIPVGIVTVLTAIMAVRSVVHTRDSLAIKVKRISTEGSLVQARRIDRLTGLTTRGAFIEDLMRMMDSHDEVIVLIADLDQFRRINDALGPQSGDMVLAHVGKTLTKWNDGRFITGRLGPNSFGVAGAGFQSQCAAIANELLETIRGDYDLGEFGHVQLGCSVGVYNREPNDSADHAIQQAEAALVQAKRIGRGTISTATPLAHDVPFPYTGEELRLLIRRNAIELQIRPIVDLTSDQTVAIQTRVHLNDGHDISWSQLYRAAREYGITRDLERWTLKESCQIALAKRTPIWVMVQARQLYDQFFVGDLQDFLSAYRIPRDQITLSIKERISFAQGPHPSQVLTQLRNMGVRLALEEFGTGAFSFTQIRELPVQTLSLDGQFVGAAVRDPRSRSLIESVVIAANGLNVSVMATGVESQATRDIVLDAGCTLANGPLWGEWESVAK
ncbi:EAL domain-containing protein [Stomatohabitans albus]|uniref:EAL domain-containing protein n=1 Tax=Stomatohabitans albus TaxID=3110766 RepID=UPI00300D096C